MKKDMSLEGLRWSCDSGSALYDTPPNGRSRTGWVMVTRKHLRINYMNTNHSVGEYANIPTCILV